MHKKLFDLNPIGILTYNYDMAHENALNNYYKKDKKERENWKFILPSDDDKIIDILKDKFATHFFFKMHGTVRDKKTMVLTRESYRDLFVRYPYYKAFLQQIFTNYHLLIIGFGMTDPDFDMMMQNVFSTFGSPIQKHILIKHIDDESPKDALYRLRYGIHCLYISDFGDIEKILTSCTQTPGQYLKNIINNSISEDLAMRHISHENARNLCDMGKICLATQLIEKIEHCMKETDYNDFEASEYIYLFGVVVNAMKGNIRKKYKEFLMKAVDAGKSVDTVAYALIHLRDVLEEEDISRVLGWIEKYRDIHALEQKNNRPYEFNKVYSYCTMNAQFLIAKYDLEESALHSKYSIGAQQLALLKS